MTAEEISLLEKNVPAILWHLDRIEKALRCGRIYRVKEEVRNLRTTLLGKDGHVHLPGEPTPFD